MIELHAVVEHRNDDLARATRVAPRLESADVTRPLAVRERPLRNEQWVVRRPIGTRRVGLARGSSDANRREQQAD
jgi:hypothetical protein